MLHLGQILHPLPVDRAQHHVTLHHGHQVRTDFLGLSVVGVGRGPVEILDQTFGTLPQRLIRDLSPRRQGQVRGQVLHQPVEIPVLGVAALAVLIDTLLDDLAHVA